MMVFSACTLPADERLTRQPRDVVGIRRRFAVPSVRRCTRV